MGQGESASAPRIGGRTIAVSIVHFVSLQAPDNFWYVTMADDVSGYKRRKEKRRRIVLDSLLVCHHSMTGAATAVPATGMYRGGWESWRLLKEDDLCDLDFPFATLRCTRTACKFGLVCRW